MKEHTKILIADDEALARKRIVTFLAEDVRNFSVMEATNGKETIQSILDKKPDVVFLDIKMTDMSGFDVLQRLPDGNFPIIIFVTAFDNFAVKAFEVQAIDFLLKPYKKDRFLEALERGLIQLERQQQEVFQHKMQELMAYLGKEHHAVNEQRNHYLDKVVLKIKKKYIFVEVQTILYIKASGYYAEIFTRDQQKYVHRISMTDFISRLNPQHFSRVNRSSIINRNYIKEIVGEGLGDYSVVMKDQQTFALSKSYKVTFLQNIGIK